VGRFKKKSNQARFDIIVIIEMLTKYKETWFSGADYIPLHPDKQLKIKIKNNISDGEKAR
jgi:hypothetical protein